VIFLIFYPVSHPLIPHEEYGAIRCKNLALGDDIHGRSADAVW
jgi:hypothetical protein